ncbi:MAG: hypothetical protein IPQ22_00660 [Rhodoferax sp.]|nr:hypothetical protein [Rhodoferax sp.]
MAAQTAVPAAAAPAAEAAPAAPAAEVKMDVPAAAPAAAKAAVESTDNPYGIGALWKSSDAVTKIVF